MPIGSPSLLKPAGTPSAGRPECALSCAVRSALAIADPGRFAPEGRIRERRQLVFGEDRFDRLPDGRPLDPRAARLVALSRRHSVSRAQLGFEGRVEQAALEDLAERSHGGVRRRCQIVGEIELEVRSDHRAVAQEVVEAGNRDVEDLGTGSLEGVERLLDDTGHFLILWRRAEKAPHDADPGALQRVGSEAGAIRRGHVARARRCRRIRGIGAHGGVEQDRQIGNRARDWAADVLRAREGHDARPARQALRSAQAHQAVVRRRVPDRPARIAAHAGGGEVRADGRPRPAARSPRVAIEVVGISGLTEARADGVDSRRELVHVRLAEDDGAGRLEPLHLKRVASGLEADERDRSRGGRHLHRLVVVFHQHRDAVRVALEALGLRAPRRVPRRRSRARGLTAAIALSAGPCSS